MLRHFAELVADHGAYTAHNIHLPGGIQTLGVDREADKLARIVQIVADLGGKPFEDLSILDLGCLEGGYAIELARRGSRVVAVEGREANLAKARFAAELLGLDRLELIRDDVRSLTPARYGRFDVVLCLGLLYHLDAPDCFELVHRIAEVCERLAVIDTYVGISAPGIPGLQPFAHRGRTYWGRSVREHEAQSNREERLADLWASLDNPRSVWIAERSLLNLLIDAGFSSVLRCEVPLEPDKPADRLTLVALRGARQRLLAMPEASGRLATIRLQPGPCAPPSRKQRLGFVLAEGLTRLVPKPLRRVAKAALGRT